jgi:hypothetical protein
MARYRLGRVAEARADFDRALKWRRDHPNPAQPGWSEELDAFQAEARALLTELPARTRARRGQADAPSTTATTWPRRNASSASRFARLGELARTRTVHRI